MLLLLLCLCVCVCVCVQVVVSHAYDSAPLQQPTHAALLDKKVSFPRAPFYEEMELSSPKGK